MFLIIGISPKTITIDNNPRICPFCGLAQAYYKILLCAKGVKRM